MAKARKLMGLFTILLASILLVACGQKTTKDGVPTILQDKYSGYSKVSGSYRSDIFSEGGSELIFNKKKQTITNTSYISSYGDKGVTYYYQVVPENKLTSEEKGILTKHKSELEGKDYFLIRTTDDKEYASKLVDDTSGLTYGVVLSDGGKAIRIFEFESSGAADVYYDFSGQTIK
ncbi:hypothetical protein ACVR0P_08865 [Streptococcus castoreus]|uniref:hypothetical protein n=1 Tax=Streptococcus castoreus TaxID=254786 RepID=UPI000411E064|nr:hypothetical protein [Streptococcus castoreus]